MYLVLWRILFHQPVHGLLSRLVMEINGNIAKPPEAGGWFKWWCHLTSIEIPTTGFHALVRQHLSKVNVQSCEYRHVDARLKTGTVLLYFTFDRSPAGERSSFPHEISSPCHSNVLCVTVFGKFRYNYPKVVDLPHLWTTLIHNTEPSIRLNKIRSGDARHFRTRCQYCNWTRLLFMDE